MVVNGQLHALGTLPPGKEPILHVEQEAPEPLFWRRLFQELKHD